MNKFLPITGEDAEARGWDTIDYVLVTGDAYVDHPSFGAAIVSRVLEAEGFRVSIIAQPNINLPDDLSEFGRPAQAFFVTGGNIDSMVAHYTVAKNRRNKDLYSPGGVTGKRPDRAVIAYCRKLKELYPDCPVIIGGLEASLRRFAHYDYWDDAVRPSILVDSRADLLVYGMGEAQTRQIVARLSSGESIRTMTDIKGTCCLVDAVDTPYRGTECPSYENVLSSKSQYAVACRIQQDEQDPIRGRTVKQRHGGKTLIQNEPMPPLDREELDRVYALEYTRTYHPMYERFGGVPALEEVEFSITQSRGCFGACNFCSLAFHQGRYVTSRSKESIVNEAKRLTRTPGYKGNIHDIGGPTANFRAPSCELQKTQGLCKAKKCLAPKPCPKLTANHAEYLEILREVRKLDGVKKVFIRSGIRFDYLLEDKNDEFFRELVAHHVSGQLKVAPEHCSQSVLEYMGKPSVESYQRFSKRYFALSKQAGKEQYLVPYFISSHPGCTLKDAVELAVFLKKQNLRPEQVQDFYPTPGTISTCMYYTGLDPYSLQPVYTAVSPKEKAMQRALMQCFLPQNRSLVEQALRLVGRTDLIARDSNALISPAVPTQRKSITARRRTDEKKRKR